MDITPAERAILANQYRILEHLEPAKADEHKRSRAIVELGYAFPIDGLFQGYDHSINREICKEVTNILWMFSTLQYQYVDLDDKSDIEDTFLNFDGFDANNESDHIAFCRWFVEDGSFPELKGNKHDYFDSHSRRLPRYKAMYAAFNDESADVSALTRDDFIRITCAALNP